MTNEEAIAMLKSKMDGSVDTSYEWAETVRMAIESLQEVQKHEETFEWCTDCKEYDKVFVDQLQDAFSRAVE